MSIFNSLLTGGIIIGKICQALGQKPGARFHHKESGISFPSNVITSGGIVFYRKENESGIPIVYAANVSPISNASIVMPNDVHGNGLIYTLTPLASVPFAEADSPNVAPDINITCGMTDIIDQSPESQVGGGSSSIFRAGIQWFGYW